MVRCCVDTLAFRWDRRLASDQQVPAQAHPALNNVLQQLTQLYELAKQ
jgi:hypothetical protein